MLTKLKNAIVNIFRKKDVSFELLSSINNIECQRGLLWEKIDIFIKNNKMQKTKQILIKIKAKIFSVFADKNTEV